MKTKVLLNGVGRIGKAILRMLLEEKSFEVVAINEINPHIKNLTYSINYDSTYGTINDKFKIDGSFIINKKAKIKILNHSTLLDIDLKNIDVIIDASGKKNDIELLKTLDVKAVFLTHPNQSADINMILGVNEKELDINTHKVISTSSCNATALLPVLNLIDKEYKINFGDIITIHPLLNHQRVLDGHYLSSETRDVDCNYEFGRSSTQNIIPTKTTTIDACSYVKTNINSKIISSNSLRVPTETVGAISVSMYIEKLCTKNELIKLCQEFEKNQKFDVMINNFEALVSSDFKKERFTTVVDHRFTDVRGEKMIKLLVWYDNEWGYSSKVVDILKFWSEK